LIIVDRGWRVLFANAAAERLTRRSCAELIGNDIRTLLPDGGGQRFEVECQKAIAGNVPVAFEEFYPKPIGAWIEVQAYPSADCLSLLFRDVTRRRSIEEALRESEERYRSLFTSMTEGFAVLESVLDDSGLPCDARFLEINPAFETLTDIKREDVLGRLASEVLPAENARWITTYGDVAITGESKTIDHYSVRSGRHYVVLVYRPAPRQFAILFHDVTDREQLEKERRDLLTKYSVLFNSFPLGISVTDAEGGLLEVNPAGVKLLGLPWNEHRRRRIDGAEWRIVRADGTPMPPEEFAGVRALSEQRPVEGIEMGLVRPDGGVSWLSMSAAPLPLEGYGVVVTYGDVSRRREAEAAVARSEAALRHANDELFAANEALQHNNETLEARVAERTADLTRRTAQLQALAHDLTRAEEAERRKVAEVIHDQLQQVLSVARMKLDMARDAPASASVRKALADVDALVADSLAITRSLTAELRPAILDRSGLANALRWVGRWYSERFGLHVTVEVAEEPETDEETRVVLFRSVRELLFNVIKHAGTSAATVRIGRTVDGRAWIVVSDKGVGFDPEILRGRERTVGGFGLFNLRERLDMLGGRLEVESAPGRGARFTIVGPPSHDKAGPPAAPAGQPASPRVRRPAAGRKGPARRGQR
jgi:PAS domain S-box-containing protein